MHMYMQIFLNTFWGEIEVKVAIKELQTLGGN